MATNDDLIDKKFFDNSFQTTLENIIADQFPMREEIINKKKAVNFNIQTNLRKLFLNINEDNLEDIQDLFLYPMENGDQYRIGDSNYLIYYILQEDETIKQRIINKIEQMNKLANNFPDIDFYIYRPIQAHETSLFDKANHINSYGEQYNKLFEEYSEIPVSFLKIYDLDDYKDKFYASDHHWNQNGSYQGYLDIHKLLNIKEDVLKPSDNWCMNEDTPFYGTRGNVTGRVLAGDRFCVLTYDFPEFDITNEKGEKVKDDNNPNAFAANSSSNTGYYYNDAYSVYGGLTTFDTNSPDKENILVVGDSYMRAVAELIASHFNKSYFYAPADANELIDYDEFLKNHDVDKVLFMYTIENYFYEDEWGPRYELFDIYR